MLISKHDDAIGQPDGLDQRQIGVAHGVDHQIAHAGIRIDHLDQKRAAEQDAELHAGERQRRQRRVLQRVAEQDLPLGQAAQPRLLDVVLVIDVEQAGAQHAHDGRREREPEREGRQDQMLAGAPEHIEASDQQSVEQNKAGDVRLRQIRRDLAR